MLKWLYAYLFPMTFILNHPEEVQHHYVSHSYDPDEVLVYYGSTRIYRYW